MNATTIGVRRHRQRASRLFGRMLGVVLIACSLLIASCSSSDSRESDDAPQGAGEGETQAGDRGEVVGNSPDARTSAGPGTPFEAAQEWADAFVEGRCADAIELTEFLVGTASGFREDCEEFAEELDEMIAHGLRVPVEYRGNAEFFQLMRDTVGFARAEVEEEFCVEEWASVCSYEELWFVTTASTADECWTSDRHYGDEPYDEYVHPCGSVLGSPFVVLTADGWRVLNQDTHDDDDDTWDVPDETTEDAPD